MTSDGISTKDWDVVKDFAAKIANAICGNKDLASHNLTMDLFRYLEIIEKKYGTLPSILATRADYIRETSKRVKLLEQAWGLAKKMSDKANLVLVSSSLAEFFIEELGKAPEGKKWLSLLEESLEEHWDDDEYKELQRLTRCLERLQKNSVGRAD